MPPLKQAYNAPGEIPAALQEYYAEVEGKWLLQTEPSMNDIPKLQAALNTERTLRRDAEKGLSDMKVRFEDIDPDDVQKMRERLKGLDDSKLFDEHGLEALVTKRTQTMKDEHTRVLGVKDREIAQLKDTAASLDKRWRDDRIETGLTQAAVRAGVDKLAVRHAVMDGRTVFTELDDKGQLVAKQGEDVRYGKDGVNPLTPDEWFAEVRSAGTAPHLWPRSSGGGAPANHGGGPSGIDYAKLTPTERLTQFRQQQSGGRT
jgi:hypothetical protein